MNATATRRREHLSLDSCGFAAIGLWLRNLKPLMSDEKAYGSLVIGDRRLGLSDAGALARHIGNVTANEVSLLLLELAHHEVFTVDEAGTIVCPEMIRSAQKREAARRNGRKGGNPALRKPEPAPEPEGPTLFEAAGIDFVWEGIRKRRVPNRSLVCSVIDDLTPIDLTDLDDDPEPDQRWLAPKPAAALSTHIGTSGFLHWFGKHAVEVGALPAHVLGIMNPEDIASQDEGRKYASALLTTYGREECEIRARRMFDFCKSKRWRATLHILSDRWDTFDGKTQPNGKPVQVLSPAAQEIVDRFRAHKAEENRLKGIA